MRLDERHIAAKNRVGRLGDDDVYHVATTGGLHLMIAVNKVKKGAYRTLGAGPHVGIARFLAEKAEPSMVVDELAKSEELPATVMAAHLPLARRLTETFRRSDPR